MVDRKRRFRAIEEADDAGHVALCRELCENFLQDYPDHWPTLVMLADQLKALRLYHESETALDQAATFAPAHAQHLILAERGHLLRARGRFAAAEATYLQAHDADPDDAAYLIYAGMVTGDLGEIERSLEYFTKAVSCRDGSLDEAHFNRGGKLLALRRYAEAMDAYRAALRIDPDYDLAKIRLKDLELLLESGL